VIAAPHHVACAVNRLQDAIATYSGALGLNRRTRAFDVASQNVRVSFIELSDSFFLELVAPLNENARLSSFLRCGFYHLCFLVENLEASEERLRGRAFLPFPAFISEAFAGCRCQFFLTPEKHLVELAEMSAENFRDFFHSNLETGS
jgi:catechol 2,3-dioxygenase-like lactoylglutathione lyase family enzyme